MLMIIIDIGRDKIGDLVSLESQPASIEVWIDYELIESHCNFRSSSTSIVNHGEITTRFQPIRYYWSLDKPYVLYWRREYLFDESDPVENIFWLLKLPRPPVG